MASGDDPPRKSFASKFRRKKITTSRVPTQTEVGEGPSVAPDLPTPPPPPPARSQQPSPEQGQGQLDPPLVAPPYFPGHFPPSSTSPRFPSPDPTHASPFYLYYPPPSSQAAGPSTGPHPPYPYPYYYPYPVQHEQGGPSRPPEVGASDPAAATDKRQYIEPDGDK
ncbi:leucine-rich repeat extensin-like protein 5 [Dendrobium catenatum]|uniref:leucine-rich repeat extensin-like protein 5 n=1 Tax=Dendrobium catenatum TaxID=906689 RepID=UPI0009F734B2|nr:leucine-rich repeat extensin-like protein 5 [Dendrobium catenatum]